MSPDPLTEERSGDEYWGQWWLAEPQSVDE